VDSPRGVGRARHPLPNIFLCNLYFQTALLVDVSCTTEISVHAEFSATVGTTDRPDYGLQAVYSSMALKVDPHLYPTLPQSGGGHDPGWDRRHCHLLSLLGEFKSVVVRCTALTGV